MAAAAAFAAVVPTRGRPVAAGFSWGTMTSEANQAPNNEMAVLATVAHELRGPPTALATSSDLLAED